MSLYEIEFPLAAMSVEAVEEALLSAGATSITFLDRGDEPVLEPKPGEMTLWSDTLVRALFREPERAAANIERLSTALGPQVASSARVRAVVEQVWERAWLADWKPLRFGRRLWVLPRAAAAPPDTDAVVVRLDPGLAFGTGTHPTTALCLQILESLELTGAAVIDYGCGSGILGIAALKLGAARVVAVDIDPQALLAARDNARRNGVAGLLRVQGVDAGLGTADCVVANILAAPLIELAPRLTRALRAGGHLLLCGLLTTQAYQVKAAYAAGFVMVQVVEREEWCCIIARRVP